MMAPRLNLTLEDFFTVYLSIEDIIAVDLYVKEKYFI